MNKVEHYLITLQLNDGLLLHSYLITNQEDRIKNIVDRLIDKADELGGCYLPVVLVTKLDSGVKVVQAYLRERAPQTRQWIDSVIDFHHTMWAMPTSDPYAAHLMALH